MIAERFCAQRLPGLPDGDPPITPLYDSLTTNLPHPVMAYTSFPFPPSTPLFPDASVVRSYLESFCDHFNLARHVCLNTTVERVWRCPTTHWRVQLSTGEILSFDLVIVANGHHSKPHYPCTPGLTKWLSVHRATHSAWYRNPRNFGKSVLVVGGGPSGRDIAAELRTVTDTVIHSIKGVTSEDIGDLNLRGRVREFKDDHEVCFEDGSTETGVDHCILATGYELDFPFLDKSAIQCDLPLPRNLFESSWHFIPLAKHIFPLRAGYPPHSLAFLGLPMTVVPFPLLEAQARAIVEVFARPNMLDEIKEIADIVARYETLKKRFRDNHEYIGRQWYRFYGNEQFDYRDQLYEFSERDPERRIVVPEWAKEMYDKKNVLRANWNNLERTGDAARWVNGVGEGGQDEWIDLMRKLLDVNDHVTLKSSHRLSSKFSSCCVI